MLQRLELRVPPPIAALFAAFAMWAATPGTIAIAAASHIRIAVAVALTLVGVLFDAAAFIAFRRARTTVNPLKPQSASSLVTSGIYRITRNPMYVGLVFFLCAWAVVLGSWFAFLGPLAFAAYIGQFQIAPEEKALYALFGEPYREYQERVRRWL